MTYGGKSVYIVLTKIDKQELLTMITSWGGTKIVQHIARRGSKKKERRRKRSGQRRIRMRR